MRDFFGLLCSGAARYPLRPLLCAAGVAATAAGIYYYFSNKGGDGERTAVSEVRDQLLESVLDQAPNLPKDLTLVQCIEIPQEQDRDHESSSAPGESLAETEQKYQKALKSITQLEDEKSELTHQMNALHASVQGMDELLSQTQRECEKLTKECKQERELHSSLLSEYEETKKISKECNELISMALAGTKQKQQKVQESIKQLEYEKFALTHQEKRLQASVQELAEMLHQTQRVRDGLMKERNLQRQAHNILLLQYEQLKEKLKH